MIHRYYPFNYFVGGVFGYCQKLFGSWTAGAGGLLFFSTLGITPIGAKGGRYCAGYIALSDALGMDLTPHAVKFIQTAIKKTALIIKKFICSVLNRLLKILCRGSRA
jgi:hypothetical protein